MGMGNMYLVIGSVLSLFLVGVFTETFLPDYGALMVTSISALAWDSDSPQTPVFRSRPAIRRTTILNCFSHDITTLEKSYITAGWEIRTKLRDSLEYLFTIDSFNGDI